MADRELNVAQARHEPTTEPEVERKDHLGGSVMGSNEHPTPVYTGERDPEHKDSIGFETAEGDEPTDEEKATLQHIGERLPLSAWLVAIVELCERFTYYGVSGLFQNYIQRPRDGSKGRGAIGLSQANTTALTTFFQFWCYVTPILGAIIADQYLGRYKTIIIFCFVYIAGLVILFATSLPGPLDNGAGFGGVVAAIVVIGLGTGGIKSNVAPLIADQYTRKKMAIHTNAKGQRVILDPAVTYQSIYMIFYFCINVGSLALLATPYMELYIDFWPAYLLGLCMFTFGTAVLILGRKFYIVRPPQGSIITDAFKALWIMLINRNMDAPKPSYQATRSKPRKVQWSDHFIDELKRALVAIKVFVFFPVFWVVYNQFSGNFVSQAAEMEGHGIPNDLMQNFDPIAIILLIPILDRYIYPLLQKAHIPFLPMSRITLGFFVAALAMVYAAVVQHFIYISGPCYDQPLCPASEIDGVAQGNHVHIAIQAPAYMLIGIAEIFLSATGLEYAYTKAPPSMKSFVQSMYLFTNAFAAAIGIGLSRLAYDPAILWMYVGLAVVSTLTAIIFWILFHHLNAREAEMNSLDLEEDEATIARDRQGSIIDGGKHLEEGRKV